MRASVQAEGLNELRRAVRRADEAAVPRLREGLKDATRIVAVEAEHNAPRSAVPRGRHMADTINPRVSGTTGSVVVTARRRSQRYPAGFDYHGRVEYQGRAFLRPAMESKRGEVVERLEEVLDDIADVFNR